MLPNSKRGMNTVEVGLLGVVGSNGSEDGGTEMKSSDTLGFRHWTREQTKVARLKG